jgi:hypothetical protein
VSDLEEEERGGSSAFYARLDWDAGLFVDREGSLLASVRVSEGWTQRLRVNVYPGVVRVGAWSPGLYLGHRRGDGWLLGVSLADVPVGLAGSLR